MNLFSPGPIVYGDVLSARLHRTRKVNGGVLAEYQLEPRDPFLFEQHMGALEDRLGVPYRPVPGLWSTILPMPKRDELMLIVGVDHRHGRSRQLAMQAFGRTQGDLVDADEIGALLRGYLQQAVGV